MLEKISEIILSNEYFAIFPHTSLDGDGLGSSVGLALALRKIGKKANVIIDEEVTESLNVFPHLDELIIKLDNFDPTSIIDVSIAVDCATLDRFPKRIDVYKSGKTTVNIDHHYTNSEFANYNFVDGASASTCQIILKLLKILKVELDTDIASAIYAGIITDTGGFKFDNTTKETLNSASELLDYGVNVSQLNLKLFDYTTTNKLALTARATSSLELFVDGAVAIMTLTTADFEQTGCMQSDSDGLVNIPRGIPGVRVIALLRQLERGNTRVNLRSIDVDVSKVAEKFNGGGHVRASGCTIDTSPDKAKNLVLKAIEEQIWTE